MVGLNGEVCDCLVEVIEGVGEWGVVGCFGFGDCDDEDCGVFGLGLVEVY